MPEVKQKGAVNEMRITINGKEITTEGGTILAVAAENGIRIPTLCFLKQVNEIGACRMCIVEIEGQRGVKPACVTQVSDGMIIHTETKRLRDMRRTTLELLCKNHRMACTECSAGMDCTLRDLCQEYGVDDEAFGKGYREPLLETSGPCLVRDNSKCILCRRCVSTCKNVQGIGAIGVGNRAKDTTIGFTLPLEQSGCVGCGQCVSVCPTGALSVHDDTKKAWKSILARQKTAIPVAVVSPYVCRQIGRAFGEKEDADRTGKTAAMLRRIGFGKVYLTGTEVGVCPAWRNYLRLRHPSLEKELPSGNLTPWAVLAEQLKTASREELCITAVTTCTASKAEEQTSVDVLLTTRELGEMWKRACVSNYTAVTEWEKLPNEPFDLWTDEAESAIADTDAGDPALQGTGTAGEACVAGLAHAEELLKAGNLPELTKVLACPGGCACGGGSPRKK
jgi:NAD-dependent dihydropyrimidine dehydrogenase PreA subunit/ferredoxin